MDRAVRGIVPVLQTPLKSGGVDPESLAKHIKWLIKKPIGGLWVLGTGSEDMHLTFNQRVKVAKVACQANDGKVPLFLGCGFYSFYDTERFVDETAFLKFDAYHYMPYHPLLSWDRVEAAYKYLANIGPIWGYSSANWSRSMSPDFVKRLKDVGLKGMKYSSQRTSDLQKVIDLQDPTFQVITAVATQFLVCLQMGAEGSTTSVAAVHPDLFIRLYKEYKHNGNARQAFEYQRHINQFISRLNVAKSDNFLSGAEEKAILHNAGIYRTREMAFPHRALTDQEAKDLVYVVKPFYDGQSGS